MDPTSLFSFLDETDQVLFEQNLGAGKVILNRPHKLNSLTYEMVSQMMTALKVYADDPVVNVVILKGNGKAFCAGGDVLRVAWSAAIGHWHLSAVFYEKQLLLDYLLATYKKPVVSVIDGIVMGGGAGLSMHGRYRIVTENTVFAMPETSIGHYPDVGASYFLSRLPGYFGEYLGLTGARLSGAEMLACGLATHFVLSKDITILEDALCKAASLDVATISRHIDKFIHKACLRQDAAYSRLETINKCFSRKTVEEILASLENEISNKAERWILEAVSFIKAASPMSLKITLKSIREGRMQALEQCLIHDYTISCHVLRRTVTKDFFEGSRAMLIEKDKKPKWKPSKLELVSQEMVNQYFTEVNDDYWEKLQLPMGSLPANAKASRL